MKRVKIEVKNSRVNEDPIEVVYWGYREMTEGVDRLSYDESALTGMEGVHTQIKVSGEEITLVRTGNIQATMVFRENHRDRLVYKMEVGSMSMVLDTEKVSVWREGRQMRIYIRYKLEIAGDSFEQNEMTIHVIEKIGQDQVNPS
ncbi:DUF1934 domain-containing protein [Proteiniclasticum ruminis]|uniref:Uncharacterized beta-barrel protein YwiB, DUF1934 family n=1 Tax=Proteiniclasticum ruminis TaxID=398199 RepID=A0A1I4YTQ6_9CLOT|nr:DUF1934 domain-containing protein [Proteiniclasticum ruminis]SFN41337.1 Uncharacterized beta-barrel protein YwiB, DUF1934 family [Proteiniclasticum ruminis]